MARLPRSFLPDQPPHIVPRGKVRMHLFRQDKDRQPDCERTRSGRFFYQSLPATGRRESCAGRPKKNTRKSGAATTAGTTT